MKKILSIGALIIGVTLMFGCSQKKEEYSEEKGYIKTDVNAVEKKNEKKETFLVYFQRPTCGDCTAFKHIMDEILKEKNASLLVIDVDEDVNGKMYLKEKANSQAVPTLVLFRDGIAEKSLIETFYKEEAASFFDDVNN